MLAATLLGGGYVVLLALEQGETESRRADRFAPGDREPVAAPSPSPSPTAEPRGTLVIH
jgi:hypothetical protein